MNIRIPSSLCVGRIKRTHLSLYSYVFRKLGDDWTIHDSVFEEIETFTCAMYGYPREPSVNIVRSKMLKKMVGEDKPLNADSKVDITRLPSCKTSLLPHVQRVNYRLCCNKKVHIPIFERPKPYDDEQGWVRENNIIEPLWTKGISLPQSVVDFFDSRRDDEE